MNHEIWLWVATAAYGLHALEEFMLDWKTWANKVLKLPVDWPIFYVVNALVVVLGIIAAEIGWRLPALSLAFPALMLINAVFFHILPFVVKKKFSPGLISAVVAARHMAVLRGEQRRRINDDDSNHCSRFGGGLDGIPNHPPQTERQAVLQARLRIG
jgi:hypothetical protein